jgi:type II secretory pathway component PulM
MTTPNENEMQKTFQRAVADIASLADWIECELERAEMDAEQGDIKCSDVGTLVDVRRRLVETLSFFSGVKRSEIQRNLDEMQM